jgi:phosphoadenosine phosphosulfate reductase
VTTTSIERQVDEATRVLREAVTAWSPAVFTTSLGREDMVLLDLIVRSGLDVELLTLDTGRLHESTHALIERARMHAGRPIRVLFPDAVALEAYVHAHGPQAFYASVALRQRCCAIRKSGPLRRALAGTRLWITGLRRAQSVTRAGLEVLARDDAHDVMKLSPLADWRSEDVDEYLRVHAVPVNPLHAQGYPSIGCVPCTRAVAPGEDERAGRWWWEQPDTRECGLHVAPDGRLVRMRSPGTAAIPAQA